MTEGVRDSMRLCVRPMCAARSEACLRYDYSERTVWLDEVGHLPPEPGVWTVCATHADSMRVPQGWTLVDRRPGPITSPVFAA